MKFIDGEGTPFSISMPTVHKENMTENMVNV